MQIYFLLLRKLGKIKKTIITQKEEMKMKQNREPRPYYLQQGSTYMKWIVIIELMVTSIKIVTTMQE